MNRSRSRLLLSLTFIVAGAASVAAQQTDSALAPISPLKGNLERITVHGESLVGNLSGDSPDRPVTVYLPPSYATSPQRRYPVLYILHGFTDSDLNWMGWREHFVNVPAAMERALASGTAQEMILVMPNAFTAFQGSFYGSSVATGDWERYVADELVAYIDQHYRTIADRDSRGLTGHSMGGYGTVRIGMKRPDVFSSIYAMSPCCMPANLNPGGGEGAARAEVVTSVAEVQSADFGLKALFATAAAWSADPNKPPLYVDLPTVNGEVQQDVIARWAANAPLATVHQHIPQLRSLTAIGLDSGAQDRGIAGATQELSRVLNEYGIEHFAEIYDPCDHLNRVDERVEKHVLPFFSRNLAFP
jgi:S-formylglutathione hydrolase